MAAFNPAAGVQAQVIPVFTGTPPDKAVVCSCTPGAPQLAVSAMGARLKAGATCTSTESAYVHPDGVVMVATYQVSAVGVAVGVADVAEEREAAGAQTRPEAGSTYRVTSTLSKHQLS